ncbi:MAG: amidohydrolase [Gammaproteobacteria bacterium]|nr:amidohydrolase [Gammaproteobacteria bacterium]
MKRLIFSIMLFALGTALADEKIEIHDAHIHYDQDMWRSLPAADAIKMLKDQNIQRALVSATPTEGAAILYRQDPDMVIPMLRPYDSWRHRYFWHKDPALKSYLLAHLKKLPYRGIGEFHVFGKNADTQQIEQMIDIARQYQLALHAHTDLEGMQILLNKAPDLVIIWAHGGGDVDEKYLHEFLNQYPGFYIELSLRERMLDGNEELTAQWRKLLTQYSQRFLLGMDTYKPTRWAELPETASETRHWLSQLPEDAIADIARDNLERLFPK